MGQGERDSMASDQRIYLDHNATSPMRQEVAEAVARAFRLPGNPSSVHAEGRAARAVIEAAREAVAALVGARAKNVIFTSCGTEANNLVLTPGFHRHGSSEVGRLLVGATEHVSVLEGHRFDAATVERIPVDVNGVIDLAWLARRLRAPEAGPMMVSLQVANNETGIIQPVSEAARIVHEHGGVVHADAVQAAGKVPLDMAGLGVDAMTVSAHKLGGPKGCGALILASDQIELGPRLVRGGGQERGSRAGTENVPGIVGFGAAAGLALNAVLSEQARLRDLRDRAEAHLRRIAPDAVIFGADIDRLPNTFAFAVPGLKAETALIAFDLDGVAVSSGSACSSGKVRSSHVLEAMGADPALAQGALRVSLGWNSTDEDVIRFAETCENAVASLYKRRANAA
jgi:cysteine desulfurase